MKDRERDIHLTPFVKIHQKGATLNLETLAMVRCDCSPRQKQVADLMITGKRDADIARTLGISPGRVRQIRLTLAERCEEKESALRFQKIVERHGLRNGPGE